MVILIDTLICLNMKNYKVTSVCTTEINPPSLTFVLFYPLNQLKANLLEPTVIENKRPCL